MEVLDSLHQLHHLIGRRHRLEGYQFDDTSKVALTEIVVDIVDNLVDAVNLGLNLADDPVSRMKRLAGLKK